MLRLVLPQGAPEFLNGYKVTHAHPTPGSEVTRKGFVVMLDKGEEVEFHRYITGWTGQGDQGWHHGHYFSDKEKALSDYGTRVRRGY